MGLSSSQGRLLMLTSRMSDIEFQQIMLSQRQNRLAWDQEKIAKEYSDAMNNYKLEIKMPDLNNKTGYSNQPVTYANLSEMGYLICDAQGNIYIEQNDDGSWVLPTNSNGQELLIPDENSKEENGNYTKAFISESYSVSKAEVEKLNENIEKWEKELTEKYSEDKAPKDEASLNNFNSAKSNIEKQIAEARTKIDTYEKERANPTTGSYKLVKAEDKIMNTAVLQQQVMNGQLYLVNTNDKEVGLTPSIMAADTGIMWVLDTSDDAMAESVYNYETTQLERKENAIELEIKQLETQHQAISKEYESVEKLIDNNIERTFKLFSNG